jgi:2-desacetyl-2-hydroxyethyl bacteriochlorophyllide A dehydrogenase
MKAIVSPKYGPPEVLEFREIEKPAPKDDEVLVRVHATSINQYDWHLLTADIFLVRLNMGFWKPKYPIPGADIAGRVEAVGPNVTQFRRGDEVFGDISARGAGGMAEYVSVPEKWLALKPTAMTFEQAAAVPMAGLTALQGLRDVAKIQAGHKVVIQGAAGGVGTYAVQIAKAYGAEVTAVCSTRNVDQARSLGADHVIDYTREDFTNNGKQYDIIFAANGYHSLSDYRRALAPHGTYVMAGGQPRQMFQALLLGSLMSERNGRKMKVLTAKPSQQDLNFMKELIEAGKVRSVIDKCYPLNEAAEALRYLGTGHARGKVIVTT